MKFQERSYNSKIMRPRPLVYQDQARGFILIMTPWGSQESCQKVIDYTSQFLLTASQDSELTTPFQSILSLSDEANKLRVATLMANDFLYRSLNAEKYELVVETLFLSFNKRHVAWCQMGCPHLIVKKHNGMAQPISFHPETNSSLANFPMPLQFLGSEPTIAPRCGDLYLEKKDSLLMLSSSIVPSGIWSLKESGRFEDWTEQLVQYDGSQPFWLSRLQFD